MTETESPLLNDDTCLTTPDAGFAPGELQVSVWLADLGDVVYPGDAVVELLAPGISITVASPIAGVLSDVRRAAGARVNVGDTLGHVRGTRE